ncbi:MAG TPA: deoxyribodipyrimidine photo-lyase [Ohtaekwangia sp.]|nr:deoxyribodipyrimidine photo-lyase [Ohtaekwangia sp.]
MNRRRTPLIFNLDLAKKLITSDVTLFWMRRDLRIDDNAAFYHALRENTRVLPLFIFDTNILDALEDHRDRRVVFIHKALHEVQTRLQEHNSSVLVLHGNPIEIFRELRPRNVYTNTDYESYAIERDLAVTRELNKNGITFHAYKDHVIFEKDEVVKSDGKPYTVFTPYSRQWKKQLNTFSVKPYPCEKYLGSLYATSPLPIPDLTDIGFSSRDDTYPERKIPLPIIRKYDQTRDFPSIRGTSMLGVHLRFGTVSIRKLVAIALKTNETWLNELIWREFYSMILWHFPHVEHNAFKPKYDNIPWRNDEMEFKSWCEGTTGYPLVDAGMRELNATGFMHNRVRMVTASFLTRHLLIDWRWGEAYFAQNLLDYELASNNGGWQWAAGSGCDAAPYFRIFNPLLQQKKFDREMKYIRKWIPEYGTPDYPGPIVAHEFARYRALRTYSQAVS